MASRKRKRQMAKMRMAKYAKRFPNNPPLILGKRKIKKEEPPSEADAAQKNDQFLVIAEKSIVAQGSSAASDSKLPTSAVAEGLSASESSKLSTKDYISLCVTFMYTLDHFEQLTVPCDGDSFYASIMQFIKIPSFIEADHVRQSIDRFYIACDERALKKHLNHHPSKYAKENEVSMYDVWVENKRMFAATTLFQRPIYVFIEREARGTGYDIYRYAPMFDFKNEWQVYGEPEIPIVLRCFRNRFPSDDFGSLYFDALVLRQPQWASMGQSHMSPPKVRLVLGPSTENYNKLVDEKRKWKEEKSELASDNQKLKNHIRVLSLYNTRLRLNTIDARKRLQAIVNQASKENLKRKVVKWNQLLKEGKITKKLIASTASKTTASTASTSAIKTACREHDYPHNPVKQQYTVVSVPPRLKIGDVDYSPKYKDISKEMTVELAKETDSSILRIKPKGSIGQYRLYYYIKRTRLPLSVAHPSSKYERVRTLTPLIRLVAGSDNTADKALLIGAYLKNQPDVLDTLRRMTLAKKGTINCLPKFDAATTLDIIHDLDFTWSQVARLRRALNAHNANPFASKDAVSEEVIRREIITKMREDTIRVREIKDGSISMVNRVCHRAPNLVKFVQEMYDRTLKHNVMRDDANFGDKIWLAIGGDKGGTTTKLVISFGNVAKTNSFNNLHILAMYEGDDTEANLREVLSLYESEWEQLRSLRLPAPFQNQNSTTSTSTSTSNDVNAEFVKIDDGSVEKKTEEIVFWPVRIILFGDLLFLARMMGLSGASSGAPCIFCTVKREQLKKLKKGSFENITSTAMPRQLIQWDEAFEIGQDAMQLLSIKSKPILPIEICDINPPVLHIMLGIGTDLVGKIEEACYQKDLALGADVSASKEYKRMCKIVVDKTHDYEEAAQQYKQAEHILEYINIDINANQDGAKQKKRKDNCAALICLSAFFGEQTSWTQCVECGSRYHLECCLKMSAEEREMIIRNENAEWTCPTCHDGSSKSKNEIRDDASALCRELKNIEDGFRADLDAATKRRDEFYNVVKGKQGAATESFNDALFELGVDRQAFQGGVLIGNHIKKLISDDGPRVTTRCLDGDTQAQKDERELFCEMLSTLGKIVHLMCATRFLTDDEIDRLCDLCRHMGQVYEKFEYKKDSSITPKMHALVHHVPEYARRNKTVGLISEHGLESMHVRLNRIARRYACIRNMHLKMRTMIKQHTIEGSALARLRHNATLKK